MTAHAKHSTAVATRAGRRRSDRQLHFAMHPHAGCRISGCIHRPSCARSGRSGRVGKRSDAATGGGGYTGPRPAASEPRAFAPARLIVSRSASDAEAAVCAEAARNAGFREAVIKSCGRETLDAVADLG